MIEDNRYRKAAVLSVEFDLLCKLLTGRGIFIPCNKNLVCPDDTRVSHIIVNPKRETVDFVIESQDHEAKGLYLLARTQEPPEIDFCLQDILTMEADSLGRAMENPQVRERLLHLARKILDHAI